MENEYILSNQSDWDTAECICGNHAFGDGFCPCDAVGNQITPEAEWIAGLVVCLACGRIIDPGTFEIVGRNKKLVGVWFEAE